MALLPDRNKIIIKISQVIQDKIMGGRKKENFLENLINSDNLICHSSIFHYTTFYNISQARKMELLDQAVMHLNSYLKKQRNNFRERNKRNKLSLEHIVIFIKNFYHKVQKINSIIVNCQSEILIDKFYPFGKSQFIIRAYNGLSLVLLSDNIINNVLAKSIVNNDETIIKQYGYYIKKMEPYCLGTYHKYLDAVGNIVYENKPVIEYEIKEVINYVYKFKNLIQYLTVNSTKFYHLIKDDEALFYKLREHIYTILIFIINNLKVDDLLEFIQVYKEELVYLDKFSKQIIYKLIDKNMNCLDEMVKYYSSLLCLFPNDYAKQVIKSISERYINYYKNNESTLAKIVNRNMIKNNSELNEFIYMISTHLDNKDEFIKFTEYYLMQRLLSQEDKNIDYLVNSETKNYVLMNKYYDSKDLYKYRTIIDDYSSSNNIEKQFVLIASQDIWNINFGVGHTKHIKANGMFTKMLDNIQFKYKHSNTKKFLINYPHLGRIDITFNGKNQKTNIVMLPAHMMFFELFSNIKIHTIDNVLSVLNENLSVYPIKFIDNIISSFIMADLIEKVGGCYTLNEEYTGKNNINLINIFNQFNSNDIVIKKVYQELANNREDIIASVINHNIKLQMYDQDELFNLITNQITVFKPTFEMYKSVLNRLKNADYINIHKITDKNMVEKVYY